MKTLLILNFISCLIVLACSVEPVKEPILLKPGRWIEKVTYDPSFAVFAYDTYHFKIEGNRFILTLVEWVDYTFHSDCYLPQTVFVVGKYEMTNDSIFFEGTYRAPNLVDFQYNACRRTNYYSAAFDYHLIEDTLILRPTFWNVNFRERLEYKG